MPRTTRMRGFNTGTKHIGRARTTLRLMPGVRQRYIIGRLKRGMARLIGRTWPK